MNKCISIYDKHDLIPMIVNWQLEQGSAMIKNIGQWQQFFPDDHKNIESIELWDSCGGYQAVVTNVPKNILPFIVAVAMGKDSDYLASVVDSHKITHERLSAFTKGKKFEINGLPNKIIGDNLHTTYCKIISEYPALQHQFNLAKNEKFGYVLKPAMASSRDPSAWPISDIDGRSIDADEYMLYLRLSGSFDYSDKNNWPDGSLGNLLFRTGAYTDRFVLNCNSDKFRGDVSTSYWYYLLCVVPRFYSSEERKSYCSGILNSDAASDSRFVRGLRAIACKDHEDFELEMISEMVEVTENNPVINSELLKYSILTRAMASKGCTLKEAQEKKLHPSISTMLNNNPKSWLAAICDDLMKIPPKEFSQSDLTAITTVLRLDLPEQDLSSVDIPTFAKHMLAGYEAQQVNYVQSPPFSTELICTIKYLNSHHAFTPEFIADLPDIGLEAFAMAGFKTHDKLSLESRGRVFSHDLGI